MENNSLANYIQQIEENFDGKPWFGTSLWKSLTSIPYQLWNTKSSQVTCSIAELIVHMIDWRVFIIEKIRGNADFHIELNSVQDWRVGVKVVTKYDKELILNELLATQKELCDLLQDKPESWLANETPGENYQNDYMIRGIVAHDTYHLGQINLIYKQVKY